MDVTVEVVGEGERTCTLPEDATYADLVREAGYHPQEASILVDGSPKPDDERVHPDIDRVTLLRLIKGGSTDSAIGFSLPNAGPGPDPLSLSAIDAAFALLLFHRDHLCGNCREQVETIAAAYDRFRAVDAEPVSVLPEPRSRAVAWADRYDLPYPILADADSVVADRYGQPVTFGPLGRRVDLIGRMPQVVLVDLRREPERLWTHSGRTPGDRPGVEELIEVVERFR